VPPTSSPGSPSKPAWLRVSAAARGLRRGLDALTGRGLSFAPQPLGAHVDPAALKGYYLDLRHKGRAAAAHADGFPRRASDGTPARWAIPISQAALGYWDLRLEGEDTDDRFLALAQWLVDHGEPGAGGLLWRADHAAPKYGLPAGWPSALGQGQGISTLVRAHVLTGEERFLEAARAAFVPMTIDVDQAGVARRLDGHLVLEEYPSERPCAVLNGWVAALLGVHELWLATGDERAKATFDESRAGLLALLPRYDTGWWSRYSLYPHGRPDLAKPNYQRLHPVVLDALALVRPDERLSAMARRFEAQVTPVALARIAAEKLYFRAYRELRPAVA
jgi:heparosan-N-sulfate-glucuronate 5-epimerase